MVAIQEASTFGIPVNPMATVRKAAPARMKAIMQEVLVAPSKPSIKVFRVSVPVYLERTRERATPTAAASVGDASPVYIEPITPAIKRITGISLLELRIFSEKEIDSSPPGILPGLKRDQIIT